MLTYRRADGTERRELRRPEQVFAPESLATLSDAPVTDLHPKVMVTPDNARELSVGHVSHSTVRADGRFVEAELVITDAAMIAKVESGKAREVSCGYATKMLEGAGVWNGQHYDAEQTDIRYNHSGLGPQKWGRAGVECAVRLDAEDALVIDADDPADDPPAPDKPKETPMDLVTLRIDGIDAQVPKQSAQLIEQAISKRDESIAKLTKDTGEHKARLDTLQGELDGTKVKLTEATDTKRFDAAVTGRLELLERSRNVLGDEFKFDGKSAREIREAVIVKCYPDDAKKLEGKSDEYVTARFDNIDAAKLKGDADDDDENDNNDRRDGDDELAAARRATAGGGRSGNSRRDSFDYRKPAPPAWQQPLAANRKD